GLLSKADEVYDGYRLLNNVDNISDSSRTISRADNWIDDAACFNSFSEDTTVVTDEGDVPISQIQIGDFVLAWNEETNEITFERVMDTIHHTDEIAVYLTIDGEEIETTPEHPFYVEGAGWTEAEDLHRVDTVSPIAQFTSHSNGEAVQGRVLMTGNWHDETSGIGGGEISTDGGGSWQSVLIKNET